MRTLVAMLLIGALAPHASADGAACEPDATRVVPVEGVFLGVVVETRECEDARSLDAAVMTPAGRTSLAWYDDERGRGFEVFHPPRFVSWTDSDRGCEMVVYTFGADVFDCVLGAPPAPPSLS